MNRLRVHLGLALMLAPLLAGLPVQTFHHHFPPRTTLVEAHRH